MENLTVESPEAKSADLIAENVAKLRELFPGLVTEAANGHSVNVEVLKQLVGDQTVTDAEEKYGLNWHGKRRARQLALTPSLGTLRPCPEESKDWDETQNLFIEGDNLDVLRLLQKSYAGKVKLIYIDPPYNTGKDFIYPDDFRDNIRNYKELTGQVDGEGRKLTTNSEASGRFHTDWLNMMYPRLKVARNLLREDGAIFISIDDCEVSHMRSICDDVFGEDNFMATFIWEKRTSRENRKVFSYNHDFILAFAKNADEFQKVRGFLPFTQEALERYSNPDNDPRGKWQSVALSVQGGHGTPSQFYEITTPSGRTIKPPSGLCWRFTKRKLDELIAENRIWFGLQGKNVPRLKLFLSEANDGLTPHTLWKAEEVGTTDSAKRELLSLFDSESVFDTVKPTSLLERIIQIATKSDEDAMIIDFFAGSGTTPHAVLGQNANDQGNRRFIAVQLPEIVDSKLPEGKAAMALCKKLGRPETIAELTKERLCRAAAKIQAENPDYKGDLGFRVFKLDSSNIKAWNSEAIRLAQTTEEQGEILNEQIDHLLADRTEADILYELLLKLGLDLCVPITQREIAGKTVHSIGVGVLMVCLAEAIPFDETDLLGGGIVEWHKELAPSIDSQCVFRDSAFADERAKSNLVAILEQNGLKKVRSI